MVNRTTVTASVYDSALERASALASAVWDGTAPDIKGSANYGVFQALCEKDLDFMPHAQKQSLLADVTSALAEGGGDAESSLRTTDTHFGQE
jgi:hypothetical protein